MVALQKVLPNREDRASIRLRYERMTDIPLLVLALVLVPLIIVPLAVDLSGRVSSLLFIFDYRVIPIIFAIDLTVRTYLSERRVHYLVTHWYDVVIVAVPFLRPLRILRSARVLTALRLSRAVAFSSHFFTAARTLAQRNAMAYVLAVATFLVFAAASVVFAVERAAGGSNIDDYGTALWWAVVTVTTVGYGDTVPETNTGRALAVFLMLLGVSLFGFITANAAAFLVERTGGGDAVTQDDIMEKLIELEAKIDRLEGRQTEE